MKKESQTTPPLPCAPSTDPGTRLLDAARDIFVREGVKGLSVRRVAESAGVTTMAVYSRFKGKDGILTALFDEGFNMLSRAQMAVDPALQNDARLLALCHAYRTTAHAYPNHYALMLGHFSGELQPSVDSQAKAMATLECLIDAVKRMAVMKGMKRAVSAEIANRLFAFCHGWVSLERMGFLGEGLSVSRAFDKAVLALTVINLKN
jgi:AcrR family transcriptional regulator